MQMTVLAALVLALMLLQVPPVAPGLAHMPAIVAAYLAGTVILSLVNARLSARAAASGQELAARALRRHSVLSLLGQVWLLAGLAGLLLLGYGQWILRRTPLGPWPLAREAAAVAPFLGGVLITWLLDYPFYRLLRRQVARQQGDLGLAVAPPWRMGQYLAYNLRHQVLFVAAPVALIVLAMDVLQFYVAPAVPQPARDHVVTAGTLLSAAAVFVIAPVLIVHIWKTVPLPPSPLRSRLEDICRRLDLRYRQIRIWQSAGTIANAGVMGIWGPLRYVLISDALLEQMPPQHVESIFAHEAGHIISRHIAYSALFALSSVMLCGAAGEVLAALAGGPNWSGEMLSLALLAAAWALVFGWISRRFERQSDVIAAWAVTDGEGAFDPDGRIGLQGAITFAQALGQVGRLNGMAPRRHNWRHGSIDVRVRYILALGQAAGSRKQIDRTVRRIKVGLWIALSAGVLAAAAQVWLGGQGQMGP